jgi:hypothetical protein
MNDFFRRSSVAEFWLLARPFVFDMISGIAAEKAKLARKLAR